MTQKKFMDAANKGKTVFCLDYIEGDSAASVTGISGNMADVMDKLCTKIIMLFMKIYKQNPKDTKNMMRQFLQMIDEGTTCAIAKCEENPALLDDF